MDALIEDMREMVDGHRKRNDPSGYFAALYLGVTEEVRRGLADGRFTDPAQLERLTVAFAARYLDAARSASPTLAWGVALEAAARRDVTIVQHLLLGINAHINLDLGIACAEIAPGDTIGTVRRDFDEINAVLAELIDKVQASLSEVSWLYRFVGDVADSENDAVINFSIGRARSHAWKLALDLASMEPAAAAAKIERHDAVVAALGRTIARPPWWSRSALRLLRFAERKDVASVIDVLGQVGGRPAR